VIEMDAAVHCIIANSPPTATVQGLDGRILELILSQLCDLNK
jgi:hypothetical protein